MSTIPRSVEQALAEVAGDSFRLVAQSPGFPIDWEPEAERLCRAYGVPQAGIAIDDALFAQPFGKAHVAVVRVRGDVASLRFRFLILSRELYTQFIADPFLVADRFAPHDALRDLPTLEWPDEPPPPRTVEKLQQVLQTGGSPTLLGAVQALIDGGRLVFDRPAPANQLLRDLWQLLPYSSQAELWPATFVFSGDLSFHVLATPKAADLKLDRFLTEEQALDYPHGRYELALQYAIEHGDQREIDRLFRRRSGRQTLRLAIFILIGAIVLAVVMGLLQPK